MNKTRDGSRIVSTATLLMIHGSLLFNPSLTVIKHCVTRTIKFTTSQAYIELFVPLGLVKLEVNFANIILLHAIISLRVAK